MVVTPLVFLNVALIAGPAYAAALKADADSQSSSGRDQFAFVEWNPAALKEKTLQIGGEYLILDGVAFGTLIKVRDSDEDSIELTSGSLGATVTQYFFSQTLQGLFVRGDASLFLDRYRYERGANSDRSLNERVRESGYNTGVSLGLMSGYRAALTNHLTGSAGYGVVRNIPDFFDSSSAIHRSRYAGYKGDWRFEVQVGVGVSF